MFGLKTGRAALVVVRQEPWGLRQGHYCPLHHALTIPSPAMCVYYIILFLSLLLLSPSWCPYWHFLLALCVYYIIVLPESCLDMARYGAENDQMCLLCFMYFCVFFTMKTGFFSNSSVFLYFLNPKRRCAKGNTEDLFCWVYFLVNMWWGPNSTGATPFVFCVFLCFLQLQKDRWTG